MKKKPRFFCDNCGTEVDRDVKACPKCGRFFAAVRCPSCGYSGADEMFQGGCPMCGYSAPPPSGARDASLQDVKKRKLFHHGNSGSTEPLPAWTYIISIIILLAVIALISYFITK